tara:strand:+ start:233 stop:388 length:156 start_codon:yes stop_codon:yes gene_type:complete
MEIFDGKRIEKEAYQSMYQMYSLLFQHERHFCENNYLSNPKKAYKIMRPLT